MPAFQFRIHPELAATDINRAAAWYRAKLGLEPAFHGLDPVTPGASEFSSELLYDTGTTRFGVYESPHAGTNQATAARLVVDDFEAAMSHLRSTGVVFETYEIDSNFGAEGGTPYWEDGVLVSPDGERTAWLKDSEGNILAIGSK